MTGPLPGQRLTAREREIANLIGRGLTSKEIAVRLKISTRTADAHVQNMLNKLGASSRAQIVALAAHEQPDAAPAPASSAAVGVQAPATGQPTGLQASGRRGLLVAGALVVAALMSADAPIQTASVVAGQPTPAVSDRQIDDPFTAGGVDSSIWNINQSEQTHLLEGNGHLSAYVGTGAPSLFNVGVSTVCLASGDFDAQVSFELITWPKQNGVWVSLIGTGTPFNTYRTSAWRPDAYGAYLPPAGRQVSAAGETGTLRLSRVGPRWSGYYLAGKRWSWIASGDGPTRDVGIGVLLFNGDVAAFGGQEALVYFKDFHLTAGRVVCP